MTEIRMPQLGETVTSGTITRWLKAVGEHVGDDEPLYEVSTDKVDTEIPSHVVGELVEILVGVGESVAVGGVVAIVRTDHEHDVAVPSDASPVATVANPLHSASAEPASKSDQQFVVTPVVSALAAANGIDLATLQGTGRGGRVTKHDVQFAIASKAIPDAKRSGTQRLPTSSHDVAVSSGPQDTRIAFSRAREQTAAHLTESLRIAAQTLIVMEVDYSKVEQARAVNKQTFADQEGFALTYLPFVSRAICEAVREFPNVNASVASAEEHHELVVFRNVSLGVAIDLSGDGLIVPVLRNANGLHLRGIARGIQGLVERAKAKQLTADDFAGGTFTVTNAGSYGTLHTAPIINRPQVAIVGTDGVSMRPAAVESSPGVWGVMVRPLGNLSLTFDHRAFDGAYAAAFLRAVKNQLQSRDWAAEL